ncbi:nicotinate-nucleotide--dimethylbenzimidazole phosphoribosyltransferase [Streptomyces nodosus]|uniref:nicotinate-nucleotide--dimethylbenzimidazole phosphoribosyltransferase n=1 Tax=Streptomyces nodosus TaxID=40318 RepID=UPI0036E15EE7
MTDTGQVPGEGLPENAGTVEQPGVLAPDAYTYLDHSETTTATADDDDLLLLPGQQGAWGNELPQPAPAAAPFAPEAGPHETAGRDSGSFDVGAFRTPPAAPAPQPTPPRRPLHLGPPTPDNSTTLVRSLADRGPATAPMRPSGPPTTGPEYLDVPQAAETSAQGAVPWGATPQTGTAAATALAVPTVLAEPTPVAQPEPAPVAAEAVPVAPEAVPAAFEGPEVSGQQAVPGPETLHAPGAPAGAESPQPPVVAQEAPGVPLGQEIPPQAPDMAQAAVAPEAVPAAEAVLTPAGTPLPAAPGVSEGVPADAPVPDAAQAPEPVPAADVLPDAVPAQAPAPGAATFVPVPDAAAQPVDAAVPGDAQAAPADAPALAAQAAPEAAAPAAAPEPEAPAPVELAQEPAPAPVADQRTPEPQAPAAPVVVAATVTPDAVAQPAEPVPGGAVEETGPVAAEPVQAVPANDAAQDPASEALAPQDQAPAEVPAAQASDEQTRGGVPAGDEPGEAPAAAPEFPEDATLGQFVPVEGTVPTTPHLAPTPPHAPSVPPVPAQEQRPPQEPQAAEEPAPAAAEPPEPTADAPAAEGPMAHVPAPREGEPAAPEPEPGDPEPVVAQQAEDLDTRAADQEEGTAVAEDPREPGGPAAPGYDEAEREAVLRVMRERRDIRNGFRSDPIPHDVLLRVLEAAHTAPSVGHSQPWDFVVIRSTETRRTMHELAQRQREAYAKSLPKGRAKQFKELKVEAILDTPVNIVVTADPTRGGRHTLGRHTQPQMAPYSSALAVENLWLAARAEGLGVGWVSFFDEREMVRTLGLPEHLEIVAYLCVGYVDEFPEEPELMQTGWSKRRPLSWVVHEETYGRRALPGEEPHDLLAETVAGIRPLDAKALGEAWERQKRMTKPAGALGMLEIISAQLSGLSRQCPPPIPEPAAVAIFAGDHGVHAQGVTPWPQEVTGQMVANFLGGGAVCNAFANQVGAEVCVVDVGVAAELPATPGLLPRKVRAGTADMTTGPALTREEVKLAIEVGIETARDLVAAGNKALLTGEMGIANTTASAALISVLTDTDPSEVTGRGTGINDETLARKTEVVRRAIEVHQPDPADPIGVLAAFGGLEHAAMVGLLLGGASLRTPVILDGVSAGAAALVARAIAPEVLAACIAGHRSAEPGHVAALNKLGLRPLVDLDLRLGEGTGALLALPLVQSAARAMHEVATFDSAGVTEK